MKKLRLITGIVLVILTIVFAIWVGLIWGFLGGIFLAIEGIKATPILKLDIALGIFRVFLSGLIFWASLTVGGFITTAFLFFTESKKKY